MMIDIFVFLFGLIIGSFLNCIIFRVHNSESVVRKRSHCVWCRKTLQWYELVPLISFLVQRAQCRMCKKAISWQYPLVELATAILFVVSYKIIEMAYGFAFIPLLTLVLYWFVTSVVIVIFVYDIRWQLIPDTIMLPAILGVLLIHVMLEWATPPFETAHIGMLVLAGIVGGGFFLFQFMVSRGRWIGGGDIRFGIFMGLVLGWPLVLVGLMAAYILGAIISLFLIAMRKKTLSSPIPFGTFLGAATIIILFFGHAIIEWYVQLLW